MGLISDDVKNGSNGIKRICSTYVGMRRLLLSLRGKIGKWPAAHVVVVDGKNFCVGNMGVNVYSLGHWQTEHSRSLLISLFSRGWRMMELIVEFIF